MSALRSLLPNPDVPGRLVDCFSQAGLGAPVLFCEVPIGDGERSPIATWLAETLRTLPPQIIRIRLVKRMVDGREAGRS